MTYKEFLIEAIISMASNNVFGSAGFHAKKEWANTIIDAAIELERQLELRHFEFDPEPEDIHDKPP